MNIKIIRWILFFLVFTLTSCNGLPEDVEEYTATYCQDHPDTSLCNGTNIDDLQSQQVETMFWDMVDEQDQQDFCTSFVSLSNLDLYDDCMEGVAFFPEQLDDYEIASIEITDEANHNIVTIELIKDATHPTYTFDITLVFINDAIHVESWSYATTEAFDYFSYLQTFLLGLNSVSLSDQEVCGDYLEPGATYDACVLKRRQVIDAQETISITTMNWKDQSNLTFEVVLAMTGEDGAYGETLEGSFYQDDASNTWIDLTLPFGISRAERTAILTQLVEDTNNFAIATSTIVNDAFTTDTEAMYVPIREYLMEHDMEITDFEIVFGSTTFSFTLDNDDTYVYDVLWEYDDGWVMDWQRQYDAADITQLDKILLLEQFSNGMNTSSATHDYFCALFVTSASTMDCEALRTSLWTNEEILTLGEVTYDTSPSDVWFVIMDDALTDVVYHLQYDLDFMVDDNRLMLQFTNERNYLPLALADVELLLEAMVDDANDLMLADSVFCERFGHLFTDCLDFRSRISGDMWSVMLEELVEEDDGDYTLTLGMYDMMMRLAERLVFDVSVYEDLEENPIIMGSIIEDVLIPPDENYDTLFAAFMEDYFDPTVTDQDIYDTYNDGWEFEGLYHRDLILDEDLTYVIGDITWHADMGYTWYEAIVTFTYPDDSIMIVTIQYEIFAGIDNDLFRLVFDAGMPSAYTVNLRTDDYLADLDDGTMTNSAFCTAYASPWDYDNCLRFRAQYASGGFTASLNSVTAEEFEASFLVDFTDGASHSSILEMVYHPLHDLMGYPWLMVDITHPDTELIASFGNFVSNGIVYGFNTHGINLTTFCDEFAECGSAFDDITTAIDYLTYGEVRWDLTDFFAPQLVANIRFTYMGGDIETHEYYGSYVIDGEYYVWTLHFIQKAQLE